MSDRIDLNTLLDDGIDPEDVEWLATYEDRLRARRALTCAVAVLIAVPVLVVLIGWTLAVRVVRRGRRS